MARIKKNVAILMLVCFFSSSLMGCGNQIPEMTEAENALITEYAVGLLLKYHADYNGKLVDTSVPPPTKPVIPEPILDEVVSDNSMEDDEELSVSSDSTTEVVKPSFSIAQVLGADGFDITYRSYEICENYPGTETSPEELYFAMKAGQGNKLLVLKLDVVNTSSQESMFDTLTLSDVNCKIILNDGMVRRAYVSMLENDFMAISRNFGVGEAYEAVIITELPEADAQGITSVKLRLQHEGREALVSAAE